MTKAKTKKIPKTAYGQSGGNQPGRATQFGQPGGNPPCQGSVAANQREFYRWVESRASEEELKAFYSTLEKLYLNFARVNGEPSCFAERDQ